MAGRKPYDPKRLTRLGVHITRSGAVEFAPRMSFKAKAQAEEIMEKLGTCPFHKGVKLVPSQRRSVLLCPRGHEVPEEKIKEAQHDEEN